MRWRRRPTSNQLQAWLADGSFEWIERWLDDPEVTAELDRLTELHPEDVSALRAAVEPTAGFEGRATQGVAARVSDLERAGVLFGLLGLGPRTASSLIDPDAS